MRRRDQRPGRGGQRFARRRWCCLTPNRTSPCRTGRCLPCSGCNPGEAARALCTKRRGGRDAGNRRHQHDRRPRHSSIRALAMRRRAKPGSGCAVLILSSRRRWARTRRWGCSGCPDALVQQHCGSVRAGRRVATEIGRTGRVDAMLIAADRPALRRIGWVKTLAASTMADPAVSHLRIRPRSWYWADGARRRFGVAGEPASCWGDVIVVTKQLCPHARNGRQAAYGAGLAEQARSDAALDDPMIPAVAARRADTRHLPAADHRPSARRRPAMAMPRFVLRRRPA